MAEASAPGAPVLLDDFVERTFHGNEWGTRVQTRAERRAGLEPAPLQWNEPWVGIFHVPTSAPDWLEVDGHPLTIFSTPRFEASRQSLRGAIALSQHLASNLRTHLDVPVCAVKHPTEVVDRRFSWPELLANEDRALVQVGWYLRNLRAIYQVPVPAGFRKVHLRQDQWFIRDAEGRIDRSSPYRQRPDIGEVQVLSWLDARGYDELFTRNLIFLELFDASANNVVIEAIARETPIIVNRHPAVVEYLGEGYPLFFDHIEHVPELLELDRVHSAHEYLKALDRSDLTAEHFVQRVNAFVRSVS